MENKLKETEIDSEDEPILKMKKNADLKMSDESSGFNESSSDEEFISNKKEQKAKPKSKAKTMKPKASDTTTTTKNVKNTDKIVGDSEVSGVSSSDEDSSSDDDDNKKFFIKLKEKHAKLNLSMNSSQNNSPILEKPQNITPGAQNVSSSARVESSEDELYDEIVNNVPPKIKNSPVSKAKSNKEIKSKKDKKTSKRKKKVLSSDDGNSSEDEKSQSDKDAKDKLDSDSDLDISKNSKHKKKTARLKTFDSSDDEEGFEKKSDKNNDNDEEVGSKSYAASSDDSLFGKDGEEKITLKKRKTKTINKKDRSPKSPVKDKTTDNSGDSDNNTYQNDLDNLEEEKKLLDTGNIKPKKKRKAAKESEKMMKEIRSEQQRLQRERTCEIPYHEPQAKSVKEFLKRVPSLSSKKSQSLRKSELTDDTFKATGEGIPKKSIFSTVPTLKPSTADLEFVLYDEIGSKIQHPRKTPKPVANFIRKLEKQVKTHSSDKKGERKAKRSPEKILLSNTQLKTDLKQKIRQHRRKQMEELEDERKKLEEQIALEEGDESFDEAIDEDSDSSNSDQEEDDAEIEKWNIEENRIRLEESMEVENKEKNIENDPQEVEDKEAENKGGDGVEDDDSNFIDFQRVPTQLLKSDILNSTKDKFARKELFLSLPCEDTQDLYKNENKISSQFDDDSDDEESDNNELGFHLSLDEETQFSQPLLDTQGLLKKDIKKTKFIEPKRPDNKEETIKLFEEKKSENSVAGEDAIPSTFSMTQMLGLCSGKFDDSNAFTLTSSVAKTDSSGDGGVGDRDQSSLNFEDDNASFANFTFNQSASGNAPDDESTRAACEPKKRVERDSSGLLFYDKDSKLDTFPEESTISQDSTSLSTEKHEPKVDISKDSQTKEIEKEKSGVTENNVSGDVNVYDEDMPEDDKSQDKVKGAVVAHGDNGDSENDGDNEDDNVDGDGDGEGDEFEEEGEEENEELKEWNLQIQEQKQSNQRKWKKKAFYENEAELSGSDVGSDDEELGSEYDEYEIDSDIENLPDEEKLKKQLHKIHQKKMNDQDKHEMRLLQELYLEDEFGGSEKRKRNFRWRNIDENSNVNSMNDDNKTNEDVDEADNYSELKERNLDLVQRNKYLLGLEEAEKDKGVEIDESSQMILEKIRTSGSRSISSSQPLPNNIDLSQRVPLRRSGSFLQNVKSQKPDKSSKNPIIAANQPKAVGKSSKTFVFRADDGTKKTKKASNNSDDKTAPPRKKQRKENNIPTTSTSNKSKLTAKSIFDHL